MSKRPAVWQAVRVGKADKGYLPLPAGLAAFAVPAFLGAADLAPPALVALANLTSKSGKGFAARREHIPVAESRKAEFS
jgi:hypothetical protein